MTGTIRAEDAPPLGANEVHLWRIPLDDSRFDPLDLLAPPERERALRFHFPAHRNRFVQRRVAARRLLGRYCGIDPGLVRFSVDPYGKPSLADGGLGLHFNLAHTPGLALLVVTREGPLGVDAERIRRTERAMDVARAFFSPVEVASLTPLSDDERQLAFLRCWTRKEAVVKALGLGLSVPLDAFDVSVGEHAALIATRSSFPGSGSWQLHDLPLPAGYVGALAIGGGLAPRLWIGDLDPVPGGADPG